MIKKYIAATALLLCAGAAVVITATAVSRTKIRPAETDDLSVQEEYFQDDVDIVMEPPVREAVVQEEPAETVRSSYIPSAVRNEPETKDEHVGMTALAQVDSAVNVRAKPSTDSEIIGKIYNNCAAEILEVSEQDDGTWYLMKSGNVQGYIKAEFFLTGDEAEAKREEVGIKKGIVLSEDGLNVRSAPDSSNPDNIFTCFMPGVEVLVLNITDDGWAEIDTDDGTTGFVKAEYLNIWTEFKTAITMEEEEALVAERMAAAEAARIAQEQYEQWLASTQQETAAETWALDPSSQDTYLAAAPEPSQTWWQPETQAPDTQPQTWWQPETQAPTTQPQTWWQPETQAPTTQPQTWWQPETQAPTTQPQTWWQPETQAPTTQTPAPPTTTPPAVAVSPLRNAIVAYALQFVGNPYVHGGNSLVTGTDCSGFTYLVYLNFGIYLPSRTPAGQMYGGRAVPLDQIQPGDLLFYPNDRTYPNVGHVAMYIGNGMIVHAGNEATGIQVREAFYRQPICARSYAD